MSLFNADDLTEEVVAQFLSDHPDFFTHRQDLVERLSLPVNQEGAVSLVEIQLKRQRERINQLEEQITELMTIAASNGQHFHQFMDLQETILKCHSLRQVISAIEKLANSLSLTVYIKLLDCSKVKYHLDRGNWQRFSTNHLNGKSAYLGRLKKQIVTYCSSRIYALNWAHLRYYPWLNHPPSALLFLRVKMAGIFNQVWIPCFSVTLPLFSLT